MRIKSVIFDLNGLLINSEIVSFEIYKELLAQHQHDFTLENYAQNYAGRAGTLNMENIIKEYRLPLSIEEGLMHTDGIYVIKNWILLFFFTHVILTLR